MDKATYKWWVSRCSELEKERDYFKDMTMNLIVLLKEATELMPCTCSFGLPECPRCQTIKVFSGE